MIIFDFDQTLVDTSSVEDLRSALKWREIMSQLSRLSVYPGITELLYDLHKVGQPMAIVTKSPDMVAKAFIKNNKWPIDIVIGYHDVKNRKPHPEGLLLAMSKAGSTPDNTYHVGDHPQDTEASRAASVVAIGAAWGSPSTAELIASKPDFIFSSVAELRNYFSVNLGIPNSVI